MKLQFQEGEYLVKCLEGPDELREAMRLRHEVFIEELKWAAPACGVTGLDCDLYDRFADYIGVFNPAMELVGHLRLISAPHSFMIEKEFSHLLPSGEFRKMPSMAESTRICLRKDYRGAQAGRFPIANLLYKAAYRWCLLSGIRYLVAVIEERYYVALLKSFPLELIGGLKDAAGGEGFSGIVLLDWRRFEWDASVYNHEFYRWMISPTGPVP